MAALKRALITPTLQRIAIIVEKRGQIQENTYQGSLAILAIGSYYSQGYCYREIDIGISNMRAERFLFCELNTCDP